MKHQVITTLTTVKPISMDISLINTNTSLLRTVFNVPTKFPCISFKKNSIIRTLSNMDNGH